MKISLKELEAAVNHIKENSFDSVLNLKEDNMSIKIVVGSKSGTIIEYDIYSDDLNTFAKVRESKELCLK